MRVELTIDDLAQGGEGIGRSGGRAVFVPWTAPGDRVVADVAPGEGPGHGTLLRVLSPGAARTAAPCRHFGPDVRAQGQADEPAPERAGGPGGRASWPPRQMECGGCEWLHVSYESQLAAKERTVREALRRIGKVDTDAAGLRPILRSPAPLRYRARAKFHLDRASGRLAFFRRRSHDPVRLEECHLLLPELDALRAAIGPALSGARLAPREVALEWSEEERRGSALLALEPTAAARTRAEAVLAAVPSLAGAVLRGEAGPVVVVGEPVLRHARVPGRPEAGTQRSRPDVFQQANRGANALLVQAALELLRPGGEDVLELHCGAGNFTGPLAARARSVSAVEVQGPALDLAREDLAAARNVRFFAGDALRVASALAAEPAPSPPRSGLLAPSPPRTAPPSPPRIAPSAPPRIAAPSPPRSGGEGRGEGATRGARFGAVLLDPPREGAKGIGRVLRELAAPRAVYVSCDPATLARDVRGCVEAGYRVAAVQPVDMFPQTHHVEAAVLVIRSG